MNIIQSDSHLQKAHFYHLDSNEGYIDVPVDDIEYSLHVSIFDNGNNLCFTIETGFDAPTKAGTILEIPQQPVQQLYNWLLKYNSVKPPVSIGTPTLSKSKYDGLIQNEAHFSNYDSKTGSIEVITSLMSGEKHFNFLHVQVLDDTISFSLRTGLDTDEEAGGTLTVPQRQVQQLFDWLVNYGALKAAL